MLQGELVADEDTLLISEDNLDFLSNELSSPILISGAAKIDSSFREEQGRLGGKLRVV